MVSPSRARGANQQLRLIKEATYGVRPAGNWRTTRAISWGLSEQQPLLPSQLLGDGREPSEPFEGSLTTAGRIQVPVDHRYIYDYLEMIFGVVQSGPTQIGARGYIELTANPVDTNTVTLDGVTWTFVAAGPVGNETLIGANLQATLDQLVIDLNGSVDPNISAATYSRFGNRLVVSHDTADATGNSFTLAQALNGEPKLSAATLYGGGFYTREFHSGLLNLPSFSSESEYADMGAGVDRFYTQSGIMASSIQIDRTEEGGVVAQLQVAAQSEDKFNATQAGTPQNLATELFSQVEGTLLIDDVQVANVTGASFIYNNNSESVRTLRDDGRIEGIDPANIQVQLSLESRWSENALKIATDSKATITANFGFIDRTTGAEILFRVEKVHLPKPARETPGVGGISVTYGGEGSKATAPARSTTVTLINDVADYAVP